MFSVPLFALVVVYANEIYAWLDVPVPDALLYLASSKLMHIVVYYFVANMLVSQLTTTGAFELYVDGKLVFSKLTLGHAPAIDQAVDLVIRALGPAHRAQYHHQMHEEQLL